MYIVYCIPTNGMGNIILQNLFASKKRFVTKRNYLLPTRQGKFPSIFVFLSQICG